MATGWRTPRRAGLIVFLFSFLIGLSARAQVVPLAVQEGRCECVLPTGQADDKYFLILGSLARGAGPFHVTVQTEATTDPVALPVTPLRSDQGWVRRMQELNARLTRARQVQSRTEEYAPVGDPPRQRSFYLFIKQHDFQD